LGNLIVHLHFIFSQSNYDIARSNPNEMSNNKDLLSRTSRNFEIVDSEPNHSHSPAKYTIKRNNIDY